MKELNHTKPQSVTILMVVIFGLPFVIFGQTVSFDFINYGDDVYVYNNPNVQDGVSLDSIRWAFTSAYYGNYHPLTWLSHMLDVQWFGLSPGRHHGVNVLLHAMNGVLLFLLLRGWTGSLGKSAAVALLFAVHPLHVESVAWIAERKEVLSTFLMLLTLGAYTQYVRKPSRQGYGAVAFLYTLTLLAKPSLAVLPALLLLLDHWPLKRIYDDRGPRKNLRTLLIEKIPLIAISVLMMIATYVALRQSGTTLLGIPYPATARAANAILTYAVYPVQTLWPANLVPFYTYAGTVYSFAAIATALAFLITISVIAIRYRATHPFALVGWCWYLVSVLPSLGIVYAGMHGHADHHTYVPLIGIFILVVWGVSAIIARWSSRSLAMMGIAAGVIALFALMAYVQTSHWRNSESLWRYTTKVSPENALAYQNLGAIYLRIGNVEESQAALLKAFEYSAANPYATAVTGAHLLNSLGAVASEQGDFEQASQYFDGAVQLRPLDARLRCNLADVLILAGRLDDAERELRRAVELDANLARAWNSLAFALVMNGLQDEALEAGAHAVALEPGNPEFRHQMALAEFAAERYDRALEHLEAVLAIDEHFEPALVLKTEILGRRGIDPDDIGELDAP